MKLNPDCVRAVLLYVEEFTFRTYNDHMQITYHNVSVRTVVDCCPKNGFTEEDIHYTIELLIDNGYLDGRKTPGGGVTMLMGDINGLTLKGHELLDSLRNQQTYSRVKALMETIGGTAISTLAFVGKTVFTELVKHQINGN